MLLAVGRHHNVLLWCVMQVCCCDELVPCCFNMPTQPPTTYYCGLILSEVCVMRTVLLVQIGLYVVRLSSASHLFRCAMLWML